MLPVDINNLAIVHLEFGAGGVRNLYNYNFVFLSRWAWVPGCWSEGSSIQTSMALLGVWIMFLIPYQTNTENIKLVLLLTFTSFPHLYKYELPTLRFSMLEALASKPNVSFTPYTSQHLYLNTNSCYPLLLHLHKVNKRVGGLKLAELSRSSVLLLTIEAF